MQVAAILGAAQPALRAIVFLIQSWLHEIRAGSLAGSEQMTKRAFNAASP
jgi:hypothetical protein